LASDKLDSIANVIAASTPKAFFHALAGFVHKLGNDSVFDENENVYGFVDVEGFHFESPEGLPFR
jgi:hypothetical protein